MGHKLKLPEDFKDHDFLKIMRKMKHGRRRIRLPANASHFSWENH